MGIDYIPRDQKLNPMGRTAFGKMSPKDQSTFCLSGGHIFEDRPEHLEKPSTGTVKGFDGKTLPEQEFQALSPSARSEFVLGRKPGS